MKTWQDVASLYQIYPRSFLDTNGDGIGDLNGITEKLDYLSWLGIDSIWISPFFVSPLTDFGYDIANYRAIDPTFGQMEDFQALLKKAHDLDIKVMIDLVPCHTSDQHPWFQESRSSRDNPKRGYYIWRDGKDNSEPNNWRSLSGGSSWEFDEHTRQFCLHSFLKTQPDLNWDNPEVRAEMKNIVRFWFDMGVDGMRVDAIWGISKDPTLKTTLQILIFMAIQTITEHLSTTTVKWDRIFRNICKNWRQSVMNMTTSKWCLNFIPTISWVIFISNTAKS